MAQKMHLSRVHIRNFRSIENMALPVEKLTVVCGPNSCGKSNVMRALQFALRRDVSKEEIAQNITQWRIGPRIRIQIELKFSKCDPALNPYAEADGSLKCAFHFFRGGTVNRHIGSSLNDPEAIDLFFKKFQIIYVPPIRDLNAGGLEPFRTLLKEALLRTRGATLHGLRDQAQALFKKKAHQVLAESSNGVSKLLNSSIELDFTAMEMESLAAQISLKVKRAKVEVPLNDVGTGHQSTVIMDLYKQLGNALDGSQLFVFEEPDNHLHPSTIRSIAEDFQELSSRHQVLLSTHSPYLLNYFELKHLRRLGLKDEATTYYPLDDLLKRYSSKDLHLLAETYGLKCVEPLLSNLVIVVEGATDRTVLAELYELRKGMSVDAADILIVAAQGKDRVAKFCEILHLMRVNWRAVFDWDAIFSSSVPHFKPVDAADKLPLLTSAQLLIESMDTSRKRGQQAEKCLQGLISELESDAPMRAEFKGSALEKLLQATSALTGAEMITLKTALGNKAVMTYKPLLQEANCWVWPSDLERELTRNQTCEDIVEAELRAQRVITGSPLTPANRRPTLIKRLHGMANEPEKLAKVVHQLEANHAFSRGAMNACFNVLFNTPL
jgi:energy-coupling factor transporter ATP-binding protein EcfA2